MNVQLANPYNPAKKYRVSTWYATPKFDGIRAVFFPSQGFLSRKNTPLTGFEHMASVLESFCHDRGLSFIDGELILKAGGFQASQSAILAANHITKSDVEYHVFAVGGSFSDTAEMLSQLPHFPEANIFRVDSIVIPNTPRDVEQACERFTSQGYEGVVLRHPQVNYSEGRSNNLLKFKFFKEADLRITGKIPGEGRLTGTLGSLIVEGEIGGQHVKANVGTGFSDSDRNILNEDAHLVGKVLTVKYQSITDKPDKSGCYSLRFPSFIAVKEDRDFELPSNPAPEVQPETVETFPSSPCEFHSNGDVTLRLTINFTDKPMHRPSYLPNKATMSGWKGRLLQCKSIPEGIALIADLRLTIPKIRALAKYMGVSLKGCKYLKAEIVRWLINASLGAKLQAEALMMAVQAKQEVQIAGLFHDFASGSYAVNRGSQFTFGGSLAAIGPVSRWRRNFALRGRQSYG